jgi:hypothetical protein
MNKLSFLGPVLLSAWAFTLLTGCRCTRSETPCSSSAVITRQPSDVTAVLNQPAEFVVQAKGAELSYQWYFNGRTVGAGTQSGQTHRLSIPQVTPSQLGFYWCEISSVSLTSGMPERTHTKTVWLKTGQQQTLMSASTTNLPPTPITILIGNPAANPCGPGTNYCGYAIANNNNLKYTAPPGVNKVCITLTTSAGSVISTSAYDALRTASYSDRVCGSNSTDTKKCFPVVPGKKYVFTIYYKNGQCPPAGTTVTMTGTWEP